MSKIIPFIIGDCLIFLGFLTIIVIKIIIYINLNEVYSDYTIGMTKNWMNSPIIDIQTGPYCSPGYSSVGFDNWPGTFRGCYYRFQIFTGTCKSHNITMGYDIREIPSQPIKTWHNSNICVKRSNMSSYLGLSIEGQNNSCPLNLKNCGIIDSLSNIMCVPISDDCPINDIQILSNNETVPSGYKNISLNRNGEKKIIVFGNKGITGKIAVEFKISDNIPCMNPYFYNKIGDPYILENYQGRDKCIGSFGSKFIDRNYKYIDSCKIKDLYEDNSILYFLNNLPLYPMANLNFYTNLYFRSYIGLNKTCHDSIQSKNLLQNITNGLYYIQSNYEIVRNFYSIMFCVTIILWGIVIMVYHLFRAFYYIKKGHEDIDRSDFGYICIKSHISELICFFAVSAILILNVIFKNNMKGIREAYFNLLPFVSCGDDSFKDAVESFINNIDKVYNLNPNIIIISAIILPIPLIMLLLKYCKFTCDIFKQFKFSQQNNFDYNSHITQSNFDNNNQINNYEIKTFSNDNVNNYDMTRNPNFIISNNNDNQISNNCLEKKESFLDAPPIDGLQNNNQSNILI